MDGWNHVMSNEEKHDKDYGFHRRAQTLTTGGALNLLEKVRTKDSCVHVITD